MLPYILILVPRIGLFVYEMFLAYRYMPAANSIKSLEGEDIENQIKSNYLTPVMSE
jgi:hypothetical protein